MGIIISRGGYWMIMMMIDAGPSYMVSAASNIESFVNAA